MEALFGEYPIGLTKADIGELEILQKLWLGKRGGDSFPELFDEDPYGIIIDKIKESKNGIVLTEEN